MRFREVMMHDDVDGTDEMAMRMTDDDVQTAMDVHGNHSWSSDVRDTFYQFITEPSASTPRAGTWCSRPWCVWEGGWWCTPCGGAQLAAPEYAFNKVQEAEQLGTAGKERSKWRLSDLYEGVRSFVRAARKGMENPGDYAPRLATLIRVVAHKLASHEWTTCLLRVVATPSACGGTRRCVHLGRGAPSEEFSQRRRPEHVVNEKKAQAVLAMRHAAHIRVGTKTTVFININSGGWIASNLKALDDMDFRVSLLDMVKPILQCLQMGNEPGKRIGAGVRFVHRLRDVNAGASAPSPHSDSRRAGGQPR